MKKLLSVIVCTVMLISCFAPIVSAESGNIDLYKVFSSKDASKTEVGSYIYKWSMYLPDDAVIYKSDRANYFNMSTTSYNSNISLEVNKNTDNLSLEDLLYIMQNQSKQGYYYLWGDKEFLVDIATDAAGQKYLRIIKAGGYYDYYLVDQAAEEFREYVENRIYIQNGYIYNLTISMGGEFFKNHSDMFDKLTSSFSTTFDSKNPNIKELSDSISDERNYTNTSYGYKMLLSPYWKVSGTPNARNQIIQKVYTDEEMSSATDTKTENAMNNVATNIQEGITVSVVGSATSGETSKTWALKDIDKIKSNYNNNVVELLSSKEQTQNGLNTYFVSLRFKTITNKPYIMNNLYIVGNGYKYLVSAILMDDKYLDDKKMASINKMLNSFTLDKTNLSKYLGKIAQAEGLVNFSEPKEFKMKKYNFATKVTRSWNTGINGLSGYYYDDKYMYSGYYGSYYSSGVGTAEYINAFDPESNINLSMNVSLSSAKLEDIINPLGLMYLKNEEVNFGLAKVSISSTEYNGAQIYCLSKEFDVNAIQQFVKDDEAKSYYLDSLANEYIYYIKIGKDLYTQTVYIPVSNTSDSNLRKAKDIWTNTTINGVNYSKLSLQWKKHDLKEYEEK